MKSAEEPAAGTRPLVRRDLYGAANALAGALGVALATLAASDKVPETWAKWIALGLALDAALQRFLPAVLGPESRRSASSAASSGEEAAS